MGMGSRGLLLLLLLVLSASTGESQWLSSWIEVEPTLPTAALRAGNVSLCDGGNATLLVTVRGGAGPWRVEVLRDGKMFSLITLEARPVQLFPAIFTVQDSDASARAKIEVSLAGTYRLNRVCDLHFCNGTIANTTFTVSLHTPPSAQLVPQHAQLCSSGTSIFTPEAKASPQIRLAGTPPFMVSFSLVGDCSTSMTVRYNSEGLHRLPAFRHRGLWALTNISDSHACAPDVVSLPMSGTVAISRSPEATLFLRSGKVCGNEAAELEVRLVHGTPPWFLKLSTPRGMIEVKNVTSRSFSYKAQHAGNYSIASVGDENCGDVGGSADVPVAAPVVVTHLARVAATINGGEESTCQGIFRNVTGTVTGTPPFSLELWRSGRYFRRIQVEKGNVFSFAVDSAGNYTVHSVTDGSYCSASGDGSFSITQLALPSVAQLNTSVCEGDGVAIAVRGTPPLRVSYSITGQAGEESVKANECIPVAVEGAKKNEKWCKVVMFGAGQSRPGLYTLTGIQDGLCSARVKTSFRVPSRPAISLRSVISDVCDGGAARLELHVSGGVPGALWSASVRYPSGEVRELKSDRTSLAWDVAESGDYVLERAKSGECPADVVATEGGGDAMVTVRKFDAPTASVSGEITSCPGAQSEIVIEASGGQWPYSVSLLHNGRLVLKDALVTRSDGVLTVPVREPGQYTLQSVRDARRCPGTVTGIARIHQHPRATGGFTESSHSMCAGGEVDVTVAVTGGDGSPPPWQVTVLRDEQFFTASAVNASGSAGTGSFTFSTRLPGLYKLSQDGFVDGRGCTGAVSRPLRVTVAPLPTVTASPKTGSTCEGGRTKSKLHFTGEPPWAFTIVRAGDANPRTIDDVWTREYSLDLPAGDYVVTSVADRVGTGSCKNTHLSVPIVVRPKPEVTVESTSCKHLCRDEVGSLIVNLTAGTPPFTLQVQDQYGSVITKKFTASAGEMRLEMASVSSTAEQHQVHGAHNWTVRSIVDANDCSREYHVPVTAAAATVESAASKAFLVDASGGVVANPTSPGPGQQRLQQSAQQQQQRAGAKQGGAQQDKARPKREEPQEGKASQTAKAAL